MIYQGILNSMRVVMSSVVSIYYIGYIQVTRLVSQSRYTVELQCRAQKMSKVFAASSLWCTYSKLKTLLRVREKVDVSSFTNVVSFLKKISVRHVPRKSNVLSRSQIDEFLLNAPDDVFLLIKVVIAFGVFGAYRRQELHDLCFNDVKVEGSVLVVVALSEIMKLAASVRELLKDVPGIGYSNSTTSPGYNK
ncbi:hypothetical protein C0J52_02867 [Blattella germanica]|nr:hypothetical protein C0J52_02867 [Blattella germanica]